MFTPVFRCYSIIFFLISFQKLVWILTLHSGMETFWNQKFCLVGKAKVKLVHFWRCGSRWDAELSCKNKHLKENVIGINSVFTGNGLDSSHYNEYLIQHMNVYTKKSLVSKYNVYICVFPVKYFNEMFAVANVI